MKKTEMKTLICVAVVLIFALTLTACSKPKELIEKVFAGEQGQIEQIETEKIEEQVIWETDEIKVTAMKLSYDDWGANLELLIENTSDETCIVQAHSLSVNGVLIMPVFSPEIAAGKKEIANIVFLQSSLDAAKISKIGEIELCLMRIVDLEYQSDSGDVLIETDANGTFVQQKPVGTAVYNDGGVKIEYLGFGEDEYGAQTLWFFAENTSGEDKHFSSAETSVNGFTMYSGVWADIPDDRCGILFGSFFKFELEENGIKEVKDVELKFSIIDKDYSNFTESDIIHIDVGSGEVTVGEVVTSAPSGSSNSEIGKSVSMRFTPPEEFIEQDGSEGERAWDTSDGRAAICSYSVERGDAELYWYSAEEYAENIAEGLAEFVEEATELGIDFDEGITCTDSAELKIGGCDAMYAAFEIVNSIYYQCYSIQAGDQIFMLFFSQLGTQKWNEEFEQSVESIYFE